MIYICLIVGTSLAVAFIIQMIRGKKYEAVLENLDNKEFPLFELYGVGFSWSASKAFALKGKRSTALIQQAKLLYNSQYAEYYANIVWAQTITVTHLFLTVTFLVSGIMSGISTFVLVVGILFSVFLAVSCFNGMKDKITKRTEQCEIQLPEVVSAMAILVNSGMVLKEAWSLVANSGTGDFYDLMKRADENMKNGYSDANAIYLFGKESNSPEISKFVSALLQSLERGGAELSMFLANQSSELWKTKRQRMLQMGERAATKLLAPIVLIFFGIIIIVITAAFSGSLF